MKVYLTQIKRLLSWRRFHWIPQRNGQQAGDFDKTHLQVKYRSASGVIIFRQTLTAYLARFEVDPLGSLPRPVPPPYYEQRPLESDPMDKAYLV